MSRAGLDGKGIIMSDAGEEEETKEGAFAWLEDSK